MCVAPVNARICVLFLAAIIIVGARENAAVVVRPCSVVCLLGRQHYAIRSEVVEEGRREGHEARLWCDCAVLGMPAVVRAVDDVLLGNWWEWKLGKRLL